MTQATAKDYWISSTALYIDLNALGNPDYIQASCVSGAQILVYVRNIISYDAGHNYRRWSLQTSPTVFADHTQKYVYAAVPRDEASTKSALIVFPSEEIDIYGKNASEEQIGSEDYFYIYLQGIISSSGDNGSINRTWTQRISTGYLSTDEANDSSATESEWYKYSSVDGIVTFLKNLTMKAGTFFYDLFAKSLKIVSGGKLSFEGQGDILGIANDSTDLSSTEYIVTPKFLDDNALSSIHDDTAEGHISFSKGLDSGDDVDVSGSISATKDLVISGNASISGNSQLGTNGTSTNFGNYIADSTGATIKVEKDGTSYIEADYLSIRRAADFREITIRELRYIGGELAITPAAMQASKVERLDASMAILTDTSTKATYFKCYFETTDASGKQKLYQEFVAGDQARCQQFGISEGTSEFVKTKYYWRLVTEVGDDYIILSNREGEIDPYTTSEPDVNDNIVQLGYQGAENLPNRQSAIILSATANDAPSQKYYEGINDFSLDHVVKDEGYDKVTQSFHCNIYGNSYTGDKNQQSYFRYDAATQTASFSGTAHFDSASTKDGEEIATVIDLEKLRTKSGNLLRNTSFCGSYESISVQGDTDITEGKETFSESVEYWSLTDCAIQDDTHSESGKSALIKGTLSQVLEKPLTANGDYTLSFRGCGRKVTINVGGQTIVQELQADYDRYEIHFACKDASESSFMITSDYATICELMLTYGTLASEWNPAYSDNDKSMAEFQSLKYLTDAITEGSTTIDGGLVMSQLIKVGNYRDRQMVQETGGMSGYYNDDNSAFLWGGGTMTQALYTIQTYKSDPTYQASDEEVANMAKFVVTHGGRAILNDIILRGYIYAEGGILKSVQSPNGSFVIDNTGDASFTSGTIGDFTLKNGYLTSTATDGSATYTMSLQKDYLNFTGTDERYATIGRFTNEGMKLMLKLIDDCPRTLETSYVATIAARGSKAQNVAIHFGGGCIEGVNYRNQIIGYNTYTSSTIPTLTETLGREVGCVLATTICYKKTTESTTTMYHDVEITMPHVYWYDDGHSVLFKRFEGANNKITIKAGTFTELTNADTGATATYNTCFISDRGTFSTELQLESVMDSFDLRFFRGLSATIGTNKYNGVWVQFKHPRDW